MSEPAADGYLCEVCRMIDFDKGCRTQLAGFAGLQESCLLCFWILRNFENIWAEFMPLKRNETAPIFVTVTSNEMSITLHEFPSPVFLFELFTKPKIQQIPTRGITGREIHQDPASEACFALVSGWLSDCLVSHRKCRRGLPSLPKRVLDIRNPKRMFLFEPQGQSPERYITLSHRWESSQTITTTSSNLETQKQQIPESSLPKTFQDAIIITRRLGFRYLWIDSLCILQDSKDDWATESSMMGYYYINSTLTLSALGSSNASSGMLNRRTLGLSARVSPNEVYARYNRPSWSRILERSPLNTRGWVLQERLLPSRILHYSNDEILWECLTCSRSEGDAKQVHEMSPDAGQLTKRDLFHHNLLSLPDEDLFRKWHSVVQHYSGLALTIEADRLPALSGIASEFRNARDLRYLAGLWKEDPLALLWMIEYPPNGHCQVPVKKAIGTPTWSWISVANEVTWAPIEDVSDPEDTVHSVFDALITHTNVRPLLSLNPLGEVEEGATLLLLAHIKPVRYRFRGDRYPRHLDVEIDVYDPHLELLGSGILDTREVDPDEDRNDNADTHDGGKRTNDDLSSFESCHAARITSRFQVPNLGRSKSPETAKLKVVWFLLIRQSEQSGRLWTRVGVGSTRIVNSKTSGYFDRTTLQEITLV